jgi:hypothetical protein
VDQEPFFRGHLPSWLIGVTLNLLMGLLFANLAMTKLEFFEDKRPLAVRSLSTALWTVFLLFLTGNSFGQPGGALTFGAGPAHSLTVSLLGFYFALLLAVLPIFTTGDWEPHREHRSCDDVAGGDHPLSRYLRGLLPHAMFRAELPAGAPLMGLWLIIACGVVIAGFPIMGKSALIPIDALALILLAAAVVAAFTGLATYLSVAFRDRKAAMVLAFLTIAALCLLPFFGFMSWEASGRSNVLHLSWQFLYLTPFMAFMQMGDTSTSYWNNMPPMLLNRTPFWLVTSVLYAALAALLFTLTLNQIRVQARGRK